MSVSWSRFLVLGFSSHYIREHMFTTSWPKHCFSTTRRWTPLFIQFASCDASDISEHVFSSSKGRSISFCQLGPRLDLLWIVAIILSFDCLILCPKLHVWWARSGHKCQASYIIINSCTCSPQTPRLPALDPAYPLTCSNPCVGSLVLVFTVQNPKAPKAPKNESPKT